mgnify:CR=1 FL=1
MAHFAELDENNVVLRVIVFSDVEVNANGGEAKQLGESIAAAIQKQLVKERMPGGLLYT